MKLETLDHLIQDLIDDCISSQDLETLEKELTSNPEAMSYYIAYTDLNNLLQVQAEISHNESSKVVPIDRIIRRQNRRSLKIAAFAAAAIVIIGLVTMALFMVQPCPPIVAFQTSPGTQFTITHESSENAPVGQILEKGSRLQLSQGTVELHFESGVKSIVMAPADLTLHDDDELYLHQGTAWFHVPQEAVGFQLNTSDLKIVDLGTKFGVIAKSGDHDEVHVIKGRVQTTTLRIRKESVTLTAGNARRIDPVGRLTRIPTKISAFLTSLPKSLPYLHWSFDSWDHDSYPADGYRMDVNKARVRPRSSTPSNLVTKGRFGQAVSLYSFQDELITEHPGISGNLPRTIACWIKIRQAPQSNISRYTIMGWGDRTLGFATNRRWQLAITGSKLTNKVSLCVTGAGFHRGQSDLNLNQWNHVACVWQPSATPGEQGKLTLYINGKSEKLTNPISQVTPDTYTEAEASPIVIGARLYKGNNDKGNNENNDTFPGSIDEVFLIEGALSPQDIRHLMETNLVE